MGTPKTLARIRERFYWKNMLSEVKNYVKSCDLCQRRKIAPTKGQGLYQPLPVADRIFETISIDTLGPLPDSDGYRYCVVITDQLSRMAIVEPIKSGEAEEILEVLRKRVLLRFGVPEHLIADRGRNISSDYCKRFYDEFGIKLHRTTTFHPRSNSITENFNKVLGQSLAILSKERKLWHEFVPYIEFAYNTSVNRTTGFSPYYIAYGVHPRLKIEGQLGVKRLVDKDSLYLETICERLAYIREKAKKMFLTSQQQHKNRIDPFRREVIFFPGDEVLVQQPQLRKTRGGKLKDTYSGTWIVLKRIAPNNYLLMSSSGSYRTDIVNVERMKIYHPRNPEGGRIALANVATQSTGKPETSISETIELKRSSWIKYRLQPAVSEQSCQTDLNNDISLTQKDSTRITIKTPIREKPEPLPRRHSRLRKPVDRYGQWIMNGLN
jgi:hypothetical protein